MKKGPAPPRPGPPNFTLEELYVMWADETTGQFETRLTLVFDTRDIEQVEALHHWRASFGPVTEIEAVNADVFALHIRPGHWCWENPGEAA